MSMNLVTLLYLVASICFIQALKGLSHPTTSIRGNLFGMVGMAIAVVTTAALIVKLAGSANGLGWVLMGLVVGGGINGAAIARDAAAAVSANSAPPLASVSGIASQSAPRKRPSSASRTGPCCSGGRRAASAGGTM